MSQTEQNIPAHVAIICDGNRRWAKDQGKVPTEGHQEAVRNTLPKLTEHAFNRGIKYLTAWLFSTENWDRDKKEVDLLMDLATVILDEQAPKLHERGIKIKHIGRRADLPKKIVTRLDKWEEKTKNNKEGTFVFAFNYGGRDEILRAIRQLGEKGDLEKIKNLQAEDFNAILDTAGIPEPDLIIRTSGEQRMSGFYAWQGVYAEYYFADVHFPEFDGVQLDKALADFQNRQRRFGK